MNELDNIVSDYHNNTSMGRLDGLVIEVAQLDARIKKANQDVGIFNTRESLFGRPVTDYSRVGKIAEIFEPYVWFWLTAGSWGTNFNNWMKGPWKELHGDVVEKEVNTMYKTMIKASKAFNNRGLVKLVENCEDIRREIDDFKKYVPLVQVRPANARFSCPLHHCTPFWQATACVLASSSAILLSWLPAVR